MSKAPATNGRTIKGALLLRGDVVVLRGAVVNVRTGSTKKAIRVITGYDHTAHRAVVRHVRRDADVPVVRLITDENNNPRGGAMSERMFVAMHETNGHEGETWTWFLQLDGNAAEIDKLARLLLAAEEGDDEFSYSLELATREPEPIVDKIVEHAHTGYYASHNKVTGSFTCPDDLGEYADELYKGGIRRFFLDAPADGAANEVDA